MEQKDRETRIWMGISPFVCAPYLHFISLCRSFFLIVAYIKLCKYMICMFIYLLFGLFFSYFIFFLLNIHSFVFVRSLEHIKCYCGYDYCFLVLFFSVLLFFYSEQFLLRLFPFSNQSYFVIIEWCVCRRSLCLCQSHTLKQQSSVCGRS